MTFFFLLTDNIPLLYYYLMDVSDVSKQINTSINKYQSGIYLNKIYSIMYIEIVPCINLSFDQHQPKRVKLVPRMAVVHRFLMFNKFIKEPMKFVSLEICNVTQAADLFFL